MFSKIRTVKEAYQNFKIFISKVYEPAEAETITAMVFKEILGYDRIKLILNETELLSASLFEQIDFIAFQLIQHKPIQYILGYTYFHDLKISVNEHVLIPRPETEEIIDFILAKHENQKMDVLDIGTGSGCIPIALKHQRGTWNLSAIDVSADALKTAQSNAKKHNLQIEFILADVFEFQPKDKFDLIVSNPPYVLESEKLQMQQNVLAFEPALALFVPDQNPLKYYERIVSIAAQNLNDNGKLYLEINESFASETAELLAQFSFVNIQIIQDFKGKNRLVLGSKS
ncbi:MAG: peptide chain release factor N(5)-glutamine methyltransferase [Bacteroidota bacterium]|jgi:release factor glutamine methyltransferase